MHEAEVTLLEFSQMFLTSSFIVCASPAAIPTITAILEPVDYVVMCIGDTTKTMHITLSLGDQIKTLFAYENTTLPVPRYKSPELDP